MNRKKLIELVKIEAKALKNNATQKEIERLETNHLNPNRPSDCIYGQMTGSCFTERAYELIERCAPRYYHGAGINNVMLNGKPNGQRNNYPYENRHWSPIEVILLDKDGISTNPEAKKLVDYLKGKTRTLNLS